MNDIQESKLEKEATRFAFACGEERHTALLQTSWIACASWLLGQLESEVSEEIIKKICNKCGFDY